MKIVSLRINLTITELLLHLCPLEGAKDVEDPLKYWQFIIRALVELLV